jgi:hypothetical protein
MPLKNYVTTLLEKCLSFDINKKQYYRLIFTIEPQAGEENLTGCIQLTGSSVLAPDRNYIDSNGRIIN